MQPSRAAKRFLRKWLVDGALRVVADPVYRIVVSCELGLERARDRASALPDDDTRLGELTVLIKTFERPRVLERLVASIRRFYPRLAILIVDDSRNPVAPEGVDTLALPYDSGLSAGRKAGLERIATRYFLLLDDDFVFYRGTDVVSALAVMERCPEIDILGGEVVDLPFYSTLDYRSGGLYPTASESLRPPGTLVGGLPAHDKVANFFIGRTERVRLVDWDPALRIMEHADFFTRAKGKLLTVFDERLKVLHARTFFDRPYMNRRQDYDEAVAILKARYRF